MTKKLEDHDFVDDAPPTQPQGMPEAPTLQQVRADAELLALIADDQDIRELYAHFGVKSADDLAETDWLEFIRLAKMSCEDRAEVVGSKRTAPPAIAVELNGNTTITMRDKAVALAKMGFQVLPVKQGTKAPAQPPNKPRPPKGQYHQHIPSSDPVDVAAMWTGPRGASLSFDIGINCEGKLVLDMDDRDGRTGTESFAKLAAQHGLDLDTVVASTPSGGRHYFYKLPTDIDPATVGFGSDKLGSGIDHRSYHSLVVAAGTKRANGEYRWVRSPTESDMKEAPRSLVELCQRPGERKPHDPLVVPGFEPDPPDAIARFGEYASTHAPEAVSGAGGRNNTIALLRRAGDYGLMAVTAVETLCEPGGWNEYKAHPPWDEDELLELAESLEPSRDRPIGCDHPSSQFDRVELEEENKAPEGDRPLLASERINIAAWRRRPLKERQWVVRERILKGNVALLTGDGGVGKTLIALELAVCLQLQNQQWLRSDVLAHGPAMVVCCEDDEDEFQRRTTAILAHRGGSIADIEQNLHLVSLVDRPDRLLAVGDKRDVLVPTPLYKELREWACDVKPELLVIDNAADVYGGDEINRTQVNHFVAMLRALARDADTAVLLNAHPSLQGIATGRGTSGSTQWHNSVRQRMYMRTATKEEGADKIEGLRMVETMKNSYGPGEGKGVPLRWQNGLFVPVDVKQEAAQAVEISMAAAESLFLRLLIMFEQQGRTVSATKRAMDYAPKVFSEHPEAGPAVVSYKEFELAMERLLKDVKIVVVEPAGRQKRPHLRCA